MIVFLIASLLFSYSIAALHNGRTDKTMEGQTIQWKDREYNGRTDYTMEGQTIQCKDRQYNGRTDNTMEGPIVLSVLPLYCLSFHCIVCPSIVLSVLPLCCLSFDLWILIAHLVSSISCAPLLADFFLSSPLKLPNQMNRNLVGSNYGRSSINIAQLRTSSDGKSSHCLGKVS
jgi:hypothetical protein